MKAFIPSRWTGVFGSVIALIAVWAVFVVPAGPTWAGYAWLAVVGLAATTIPVLFVMAQGAGPGVGRADAELRPALAPAVMRPPVRR